jgi:hypothetical protein
MLAQNSRHRNHNQPSDYFWFIRDLNCFEFWTGSMAGYLDGRRFFEAQTIATMA